MQNMKFSGCTIVTVILLNSLIREIIADNFCSANDNYRWNTKIQMCIKCSSCPLGRARNFTLKYEGRTSRFGDTQCLPCLPCLDGYFSEDDECQPCRKLCIDDYHREFQERCGGSHDASCGSCLFGYVDSYRNIDMPCTENPNLNIDVKPRILNHSTIKSMNIFSNNKQEVRDNAYNGTYSDFGPTVICVIIVAVIGGLFGCIVIFILIRKRRLSRQLTPKNGRTNNKDRGSMEVSFSTISVDTICEQSDLEEDAEPYTGVTPVHDEQQSTESDPLLYRQMPPLVNGHMPPLVNGQMPPLVNGHMPPLVNGQMPPLVNGQMPPLEHGQMPPLVNGQMPPWVNGHMPPLVNGQMPPLEHGQMPPLINGEMPPLVNGQMPPLINGEMPPLVNGQMPQLFLGQMLSLPLVHGQMPPLFHGQMPHEEIFNNNLSQGRGIVYRSTSAEALSHWIHKCDCRVIDNCTCYMIDAANDKDINKSDKYILIVVGNICHEEGGSLFKLLKLPDAEIHAVEADRQRNPEEISLKEKVVRLLNRWVEMQCSPVKLSTLMKALCESNFHKINDKLREIVQPADTSLEHDNAEG